MLPALFLFHFEFGFERFSQPINLFNILFLGFGASALCFVTWNFAVKILGAVKTSVYIYLVPVITVAASVIVLHERVSWVSALGMILTLAGLFLSQKKVAVSSKEE
jgi:drug/metabolite transporter (DMT)-like permease